MKTLRILAFAITAICFFGNANAQVVVRARVGAPPQRRVVVVHRPAYRRTVVVARGPVYHHRYYRHRYAHRVVVRP